MLTVPLFLLPVGPKVQEIGYSQLKSDIAAGQVASLAIGPDGSISGKPAWVESAVPGGTHPATSAPAP